MNSKEQIKQEARKLFSSAYHDAKIERIEVDKMTPANVERAGSEKDTDVDLYNVQIYIADSLIKSVAVLAYMESRDTGVVIENDIALWDVTLRNGLTYTRKG